MKHTYEYDVLTTKLSLSDTMTMDPVRTSHSKPVPRTRGGKPDVYTVLLKRM